MMRLFKRDPAVKANAAEEAGKTVHDFTLRIPYWSYRPVPYRGYAPLAELREELDRRLEALFAGDIDEGNGDVLDGMIFSVVRQALTDLDRQRASHKDRIESLATRPFGDRTQFEEQLAYVLEDLENNLKEQAIVKERLDWDEYGKEGKHE